MNLLTAINFTSAATSLYVLYQLLHRLFSPLRSVRGPFLARFTDAWYAWRLWLGRFEPDNQQLHETYGPVVRYGPNRYSLSHPEAAKTIYGLRTTFPKSSWYYAWGQPQEWTIFSDSDVRRHGENRRQYQSLYSMSTMRRYEPYVEECISLFQERLTELTHAGLPANLGHWMQCYAFDVVGMMTYSKRLGFLDHGDDVGGVIKALESFLTYASFVGLVPSLHAWLFRLSSRMTGGRGAGRAYVINFTKQRMAEHKSNPKSELATIDDAEELGRMDFVSQFYARHVRDPETFTAYHVIAGCTQNMVAGSDTTAITLSACLYYILRYPHTFSRLRAEVDNHRRHSKMGQNVTFEQSQQMPYLQAVIKETLRIHPATGLPLERVVPEGGATICGRFFPEGTIVGVNSWVEHRNPQIWGDDAKEFKPERWLIEDHEKLGYMNRHWMPFGMGSRACLGRHISLLEMSKLIPSLVGDFDFELCGAVKNPEAEWILTDLWFVKPRDFVVKIHLRKIGNIQGSNVSCKIQHKYD